MFKFLSVALTFVMSINLFYCGTANNGGNKNATTIANGTLLSTTVFVTTTTTLPATTFVTLTSTQTTLTTLATVTTTVTTVYMPTTTSVVIPTTTVTTVYTPTTTLTTTITTQTITTRTTTLTTQSTQTTRTTTTKTTTTRTTTTRTTTTKTSSTTKTTSTRTSTTRTTTTVTTVTTQTTNNTPTTMVCSDNVLYDNTFSNQTWSVNSLQLVESSTNSPHQGANNLHIVLQDDGDGDTYAAQGYYFNSGTSCNNLSSASELRLWVRSTYTHIFSIALYDGSVLSNYVSLGTQSATYTQRIATMSSFTGVNKSCIRGIVFRADTGTWNWSEYYVDDISYAQCAVQTVTTTTYISTTTNTLPTTTNAFDNTFPYNDGADNYPFSETFLSEDNTTVTSLWNSYKSTFVVDCSGGSCDSGDTWCRVKFDNPAETVSEDIGYIMLVSAYMNDKVVFDRLWLYAKNYLDIGGMCNNTCSGLMHWKISGCSGVSGQNAATDGDEDMILALYMAHKVWGSGGAINYLSDANTQAQRLRDYTIETAGWVKNGDEWGGCSANNMNPSYFAPAWYEVFNYYDPHSKWTNAISKSYYLLVDQQIGVYGYQLPSNWCNCTGQIGGGGSGTAPGEYGYEACRATWRVSTDLAWTGRAKASQDIETRQLPFWNAVVTGSNDFTNVRGPRQASDGSGGSDSNACFQGMVATAYIHDTNTARKTAAWNNLVTRVASNISGGQYFCSSLGMVATVFVSGNMPDPRTLP